MQNPLAIYECLCCAEHKGRYSEEYYGCLVPQNSLITNFLQIIFLCVKQNKEIHTGLELLEGE